MQVNHSTGTTPFDLVLTRHLPFLQVEASPTALSDDVPASVSRTQSIWYILARLRDILASARVWTVHAQPQYHKDVD